MSKGRTFDFSINLSKISEENLYITANGEKILNGKIKVYPVTDSHGKDLMVAQRFLKEKAKDENGKYKITPILGNGIERF